MRICQPEFRKSRTRRIGAQAGPPCHHLPGQPTLIPPRVCRDRSRSATSLSSPPPAPTVYTELRSVYTERSRSPQMSHRLDPDQVTTAVLSSTLLSMFAGGSMKVSHLHCRCATCRPPPAGSNRCCRPLPCLTTSAWSGWALASLE